MKNFGLRHLATLTLALVLGACGSGDYTPPKTNHANLAQALGAAQSQPPVAGLPPDAGIGVVQGHHGQVSGTVSELIANGGFESGSASWQATTDVITADASIAYEGRGFAYLGGLNNSQDALSQVVTIPDNATAATLEFKYAVVDDNGSNPVPGGDWMTLEILDAQTNATLQQFVKYTNASVTNAWTASASFNLIAYRGRKIIISFTSHNDATGATSFVLDNISLSVNLPSTAPSPAPGIASYAGASSQFNIGGANGSYTITDKATGITSGIPASTKRLQFSDATVALDLDGPPGKIYRLYQAAFDRQPDLDGLGYWIDLAERTGMTVEQVAQYFMDSAEFKTAYGNLNNNAFVTQLYRNVLHREPDAAGLAFHVGVLDRNAVPRTTELVTFSESDENKAQVAPRIAHGIAYRVPGQACTAAQTQVNNTCVPKLNVSQTIPAANETGVQTSASIVIFFDQDMKTDQLLRDGSITITPSISGRAESWGTDLRSWRYLAAGSTPAQLKPSTRYTVTLAPNKARASTGALLANGWSWSFTTKATCDTGALRNGECVVDTSCTAPQVLVNGACTTPATTCPAGQVPQNGACVPQTTPPASGCPSGQTLVNGVCTSPAGSVCIAPQIKVNGACITPAAGVSYPKVVSITPADKAAVKGRPSFGTEPLTEMQVTFDRTMDYTTFGGFKLVHTATNTQALTNLSNLQGNQVTVTFNPLTLAGEWKVIMRGAKDKNGVFMQDFEPALNVAIDFSVNPPWATTISQSTPIVIKFNVPMDTATINDQNISMGGTNSKWPQTVSYDAATNTATLKPQGAWPGGATMYAYVGTGVHNSAGQSVREPTLSYQTMYFIQGGGISDPTPTSPTPAPAPKPTPSPTPTPSPGTGGSTTDKDGCYTPQRNPACVVATTLSTSPALNVRFTNNCQAHVWVRACQRTPSGTNNCGAFGLDKNASTNWSTQGGTNPTYEFVGSSIPNNDFVCSAKDPVMTSYKQRYP